MVSCRHCSYHIQHDRLLPPSAGKGHPQTSNLDANKKVPAGAHGSELGKDPRIGAAIALSDLPFEKDLDITGRRSIHQLIDISISREGSRRLATWLLQKTPDLTGILKRQRVVQELVPYLVSGTGCY